MVFSAKCPRVMEKEHSQALANPVRSQEILAPLGEQEDREGEEDKEGSERIASKDRGGEEREREKGRKAAFSLS